MNQYERRSLLADYRFFDGVMQHIDAIADFMKDSLLYGAGLTKRGVDVGHHLALLRAAIQPELDAINERFETEETE